MPRNTEGLKRSARLRSEGAHARAMATLQRMEAADQEINFRAVSSEARVSTAWLYNQQELRDRITRLRKSQSWGPPAKSDRERRESLSRKSIVETLRLRIKKLEEKNRELTELLKVAYGVIAETSRAACSITSG